MINDKIKYVEYEPWMHDQIAQLAVSLYGGIFEDKKRAYDHMLCHPYSLKHPPITIVGLSSEDKVIAFQMYFHWPYRRKDVYYNVYQSGNSMVHPSFRGQKIFQKMLSLGSVTGLRKKVDFFIGFPVPMSYGAFINDGWMTIGNLRWWTKILRPIGLLKEKYCIDIAAKRHHAGLQIDIEKIRCYAQFDESRVCMVNSEEFLEWRYAQKDNEYGYYEHHNFECLFVYKLNHAHGFSEIIIGDIFTKSDNPGMFCDALSHFLKKNNKLLKNIQAVSFASFNPSASKIRGLLLNGFIPHRSTAPLIIKPFAENLPLNKKQWEVSFGDIDTW